MSVVRSRAGDAAPDGLAADELDRYHRDGHLFLDDRFSPSELELLADAAEAQLGRDAPGRVLERDRRTVRGVHGCHGEQPPFDRLVRLARLVQPAVDIVGDDVYVYQFKINAKRAFDGDVWEWHRDYTFWWLEDSLPEPRAVNVFVFLDDASEASGPLLLIPGSHRAEVRSEASGPDGTEAARPDWEWSFTAKLRHTTPRDDVRRLAIEHGIVACSAPAGTVLLVHPNVVHASAQNLSPFDRRLLIITYAADGNRPLARPDRRPRFIADGEAPPLVSLLPSLSNERALTTTIGGQT